MQPRQRPDKAAAVRRLGLGRTSRRQSRQHMPPEQSEGGIGGYLSGCRLAVLILWLCWRMYDGATGKEPRQMVGQAKPVCVGHVLGLRKARDDVGGELGSVGWRDELVARHDAECWVDGTSLRRGACLASR